MSSIENSTDWTKVAHDTEIKVVGVRGRFYFRGINADGSIHVFGGPDGHPMARSFRAERCRPIHRRKKADPAWKLQVVGPAPRRGRR